ncbi:MAG: TetR/AcrR family transcriptional regulator [Bacteroidota bacterium]
MQIKKENVENMLLNSAKKEFLSHGFRGASLRRIVANAGTTLGNFYNYFESKEAIFERLVAPEYQSFIHLLQNHENRAQTGNLDWLWQTQDISIWRNELFEMIKKVLPVFTDGFLIMLEHSAGTKYAAVKEQLVAMAAAEFQKHYREQGIEWVNPEFGDILARQFIAGIVLILTKYPTEDKRQTMMAEHFLFYIVGVMALVMGSNWPKRKE